LVTSQGRDIIGGIQSRFVYQFAFLDYYEPVEDYDHSLPPHEVEENTNINVLKKTKENYPRSFEYVEAQVNVLDEVPQSYSHQRNQELDQIRYKTETRDHEYVDLKVARLFSRVYAFCEEEGHAIMDCAFVPFHTIISLLNMWNYRMW